MKKILYIAVLAIVCWSCSSRDEVTAPQQEYKEGQVVEISVASQSQKYNNTARRISGKWSDANCVEFVWEWSNNEKIKIEYNGKSAIFECTQKDDDKGIAVFEGEMPGGWQPGEEALVIAGNITDEWPVANPAFKGDGIASNAMRFEGKMTQLDQTIQVSAAWSAFRLSPFFNAFDAEASEKESKEVRLPEGTSVQSFTKTIDISAKCDGESVTYHYDVNQPFEYKIQTTHSAGQYDYPFFICIVKPGEYTNLTVTVKFDLRDTPTQEEKQAKLKSPLWVQYYDGYDAISYILSKSLTQSDTRTFHAEEVGTLEKGIIYTPSAPLECKYYFVVK